MPDFALECFGVTDVGRQRDANEDAYAVHDSYGLLILADGMGGHNSGEVASGLAVKHISDFICENRLKDGYQWPYPMRDDRSFDENSIDVAIKFANERIFIESMKNSAYEGMGTTVLAMLSSGPNMVLGHVGDSRIYRYRNQELTQVTEDHSLLNHMIRTKQIHPSQAKDFKNKNIIVRAVGLKDIVDVDVITIPKANDDVLLMCSDGLTDLVEDWIIAEVLAGNESLEEIGHTLVRLANQSGGKDNITVLLARVTDQIISDDVVPEPSVEEARQKRRTHEMRISQIEAQLTASSHAPEAVLQNEDISRAISLDEINRPVEVSSAGFDLSDSFDEQLQGVSSLADLDETLPSSAEQELVGLVPMSPEEKRERANPERYVANRDELMYLEAVLGGIVVPEEFD